MILRLINREDKLMVAREGEGMGKTGKGEWEVEASSYGVVTRRNGNMVKGVVQ